VGRVGVGRRWRRWPAGGLPVKAGGGRRSGRLAWGHEAPWRNYKSQKTRAVTTPAWLPLVGGGAIRSGGRGELPRSRVAATPCGPPSAPGGGEWGGPPPPRRLLRPPIVSIQTSATTGRQQGGPPGGTWWVHAPAWPPPAAPRRHGCGAVPAAPPACGRRLQPPRCCVRVFALVILSEPRYRPCWPHASIWGAQKRAVSGRAVRRRVLCCAGPGGVDTGQDSGSVGQQGVTGNLKCSVASRSRHLTPGEQHGARRAGVAAPLD
jgi:hypothetical protein